MTVFAAVFLPLTVALGIWQMSRGAEKQRLESRFLESQGQLAAPATPALAPFTRVRLRGHFDAERYFLLDNQVSGGRVGYAVIGVFMNEDGRTYLVNRGWIAGPRTRDVLPAVATPDGPLTATGIVWQESKLPSWAAEDAWSGRWPERIPRIDLDRMSKRVDGAVVAEVRLEPGTPGALEVRAQLPAFAPEKHWGYAVQWFGLAVVLAALYVYSGVRAST